MRKTICAGLLAGFFAMTAATSQAGQFSLTTGLDYSSGNYGGTQATDTLFIPFIGKYEEGLWTYKLTVPYVRVTGPGNVVRDVGAFRTAAATRTTESGLGDIVAAATRNVYDNAASGTLLDVTGKVKFATADENKGLGTGENDYAVQLDAYQTAGKVTLLGTVGYKVLGDPAGISLDNVWYGTVGVSGKVGAETSAGMMLDVRQKASATGSPQRELTAYVSHKYSKEWKSQAYVVKGFADGSPDWGAGAMVTRSF